MSPATWRLLKSLFYYGLNFAITIVVTVVFVVFNSNPGPASLGKHARRKAQVHYKKLP